ncbi:hypothetical protein [Aliagarivorans taiwanensis]|uniref:hypothetical protein n=1 Tax=Aliagarivorans taiwanensis TaxID=561966 RepID=UPI00047C6768|nr:hypothetical protein [Aliagarivorans taiwanensis]
MVIIDTVISILKEHRHSGSSQLLADALASACSSKYKIAMLDASTRLDGPSKKLVIELMNIAQQPDFSNADQDNALKWLRDNQFIE